MAGLLAMAKKYRDGIRSFLRTYIRKSDRRHGWPRAVDRSLRCDATRLTLISRKPAQPAIPTRVGISDLPAVQGLLAVQRLDAWLLYDRDGQNPIAVRLAKPDGHPQRPWFYLIPARGAPTSRP